MSIQDISRTAFLAGLSPAKWEKLVRTSLSKAQHQDPPDTVGQNIFVGIVTLFTAYPANSTLEDYLQVALESKLIPLPIFSESFLEFACPSLQDSATLDIICRLVLNSHYTTNSPSPLGTLISSSAPISFTLDIIQKSLQFLRKSYTLPQSHIHPLTQSASELVRLLLSSIREYDNASQKSAAQSAQLVAEINQTLQMPLTMEVRQTLETWLLSSSLLISSGPDPGSAPVDLYAGFQSSLPSARMSGVSSADSDLAAHSLLLQQLLVYRAASVGCGNESLSVTLLLSHFRSTPVNPATFFAQLLLAAISLLSQHPQQSIELGRGLLWRAFIIGRLPRFLFRFQEVAAATGNSDVDFRAGLHSALNNLFGGHQDLLEQCDMSVHAPSSGSMSMLSSVDSLTDYDPFKQVTFRQELLHALISVRLIDSSFASTLCHTLSDHPGRFVAEAQELGVELDTYIDGKLSPETPLNETIAFLDRAMIDYETHALLSEVISKRYATWSDSLDLDSLADLSKKLYTHDHVVDIISLHISLPDLLSHGLAFLEDFDFAAVVDPQFALGHFGDVVLFLQRCLYRYQLFSFDFHVGERHFSAEYLRSTFMVYGLDALPQEERKIVNDWLKAVFDSQSEGIDDQILRSTNPKMLLKLSATLFSEGIAGSTKFETPDRDTLLGGVSYFLGPLLNWTLVGVLRGLANEIRRQGPMSAVYLVVFENLILTGGCPRAVLQMAGRSVLRLLAEPELQSAMQSAQFNLPSVKQAINAALGIHEDNASVPLAITPSLAHADGSRVLIRTVLNSLRGSPNTPPVPLMQFAFMPPHALLAALYHELCAALGPQSQTPAHSSAYALSNFLFTAPRPSGSGPPLFPYLLKVFVPSLLPQLDALPPAERTPNVTVLVGMTCAAMNATLSLERATRAVMLFEEALASDRQDRPLFVEKLTRQFISYLRRAKGPASSLILQKLQGSPSFIANFHI
ncbi:hypothetical protein BOTBODRAFT_240711 [Botryobasidium botryosum FD-172 SS1]|uniref:Mediator of RNA polymerase II transcription subunit 5 n=1 Tax=Botryobasidium botryosum (strain FD-172 SS1) TaxID=930990 RepID=A0A067MZ61_BOTB1|nr:hypothetical protein BOTBODRAFT_240711 [Botryobasidium botryosum FD-172 SS1]